MNTEKHPTESEMLTVRQAASRLNVSEKTVRNLVSCGKLAHHRIGAGRGVIRISEQALNQHLADSEVRGLGPPTSPKKRERRTLRHISL